MTNTPKWILLSTMPTFVVVQLLSCIWSFATPRTVAHQSFTVSWGLLKLRSIESMMPSNHLILCCPLLLMPSFSASGSFPMSQLFASGGQSIGASGSPASVLPMNYPGLTSFRLTNKTLLPLLWRTLRVPMGTTAQTMDTTRQPWGPKHLCHCKSTSSVFTLPLGCGSFLRPQVPYTLDWATECPEFLFYFHISHTSKGDVMAWTFYHKF